MNTFEYRRYLPGNATLPVDFVIKNGLFPDSHIDDVDEIDFDDEERAAIEYYRRRFV